MYLDSIVSVAETEEKVKQMKVDAAAAAKKAIADAGKAGEAMIADAVKKADGEIRELQKKADEKAKESARELAANNENKKAAMKAKADTRIDKAAAFIVERIVNS